PLTPTHTTPNSYPYYPPVFVLWFHHPVLTGRCNRKDYPQVLGLLPSGLSTTIPKSSLYYP
ncbi:MAG: hypothetical protein QME51_00910, partial [Planctomycetota bacterium]|nr:hypothetical protein [Planctomycetota bacterium]